MDPLRARRAGDPSAQLAAASPPSLPPWRTTSRRRAASCTGCAPRTRRSSHASRPASVASQAGPVARPARPDAPHARGDDERGRVRRAILRPNLGPVDRGEVRARSAPRAHSAFELGQVLAMPSSRTCVRSATRRRPPLAAGALVARCRAGWMVLDNTGTKVGFVERVRGDHATGELAGDRDRRWVGPRISSSPRPPSLRRSGQDRPLHQARRARPRRLRFDYRQRRVERVST